MARRFALLISNSQYKDGKLAGLAAPVGDASTLARVLKEPQIGAFDDVQTLLNQSFGEIQEAIVVFFANKKPDDLALLYFSGHGLLDEGRRLFLATPESNATLPRARSIPATFISDEMSNSRSKRQVLVLDCCHSGAFSRGVKAAINQSVGTESIFPTEGAGRVVITASDATQYAFEGENRQGQGIRSVFTNYLVEGLETGLADANNDGQISINDWYQYAYQRIKEETPNQTPLIWAYGQQGEFVLARNPFAKQPVTVSKLAPTIVVQPPAAKQVRTLVVDQLVRGDYDTITAAIANANPGDRVLIHEGVYNETLVIDKPLEIIGDGQLGEVEIRAYNNNVINFETTGGVVRNLVLRQIGGKKYVGVYIPQGRLRLESCDISSRSSACIEILNKNAFPTLRGNKIHDGAAMGILVHDNAQGVIESNEIWGNALAGLAISSSAIPTVRNNKIYGGKHFGLVCSNADGLIEANEIWNNAKPGIGIGSRANPTVYNNKIHDGKQEGISIYENSHGLIETNEIWGNARSGISIVTGAAPIIRGNKIHDSRESGIYLSDSGKASIEANEVWGNSYWGISVNTGSNPTVRNNKIYDGKQGGIHVHDNAEGLIEANEIWGNAFSGIEISIGANPIVRGNTITKNLEPGIYVHDRGGGLFENNNLRGNNKGPWNISPDSATLVQKKGNIE